MLNSVSLVGRVGQDAECKEANRPVSFSLAIPKSYKKRGSDEWETKTTWLDVIVWGQEDYKKSLLDRLKQGSIVAITGEISAETFETEEGSKRKIYKIIANTVRIIVGKDSEKNSEDMGKTDKKPSKKQTKKPVEEKESEVYEDEDDLDLPF